jgi:hypothetical protein
VFPLLNHSERRIAELGQLAGRLLFDPDRPQLDHLLGRILMRGIALAEKFERHGVELGADATVR